MRTESIAYAPASVSNVACGFDIMGFALERPGDTVTLRLSDRPGVRITKITGNSSPLPMNPAENTAGAPVIAMLERLGINVGIEIEIHKGLALGSGIGSSAASAVAAAVACNALLGAELPNDQLLSCAIEGERIASDAVHVDNLSPCLLGGFVLVRGYSPIDIVPIRTPKSLWCTIIHPHVEIKTKESRKSLPRTVCLSDVVAQTGNAAGLIAGLLYEDFGLIGRSLHDVISEPVRKHLIPGFAAMKQAAAEAGALGCSISGSGPSLFALSSSPEIAKRVGDTMSGVLEGLGCKHSLYVSPISQKGARIISTQDHAL